MDYFKNIQYSDDLSECTKVAKEINYNAKLALEAVPCKYIDIERIDKETCRHFKITPERLRKRTRKREIVQPRQSAMYFSKQLTKMSFAAIGSYFGGYDHATVLFACKAINNLIETDKKFKAQIKEIENKLKN